MGTNLKDKNGKKDMTSDDVGRGLLALSSLGISEYQPAGGKGKALGNDPKRFLLGAATMGTSEVKTGSGQYHDETVADALFPKTVNDWALEDRSAARINTDQKAKDDAAAANPGPAPDAADKLLSRAGADSLLRSKGRQGRRSTFLSGGSF